MKNNNPNIAYVVSDLKQVGPTNQTFNIINHSPYKQSSIVITLFKEPEDTMIDTFIKHNITIIQLNLNRKTFVLTARQKVQKILLNYNIDLVHTYGTIPDNLCQKICQKLAIPHVITLRNYPKEDIPKRMGPLKSLVALLSIYKVLNNCKYIVACSNSIRQKMLNDNPTMVMDSIQNGVDTEKYKPVTDKEALRKKLNLPHNKKILISTSSFIKRKRIPESIKGFLKANDNNTIFVLLGDGDQFQAIKTTYDHYNNIIFLGKIPNVNEYLCSSDMFVSSSESEGLPNGVLEAIACGIPVLLSDINQHKEILKAVPNSGLTYKLGDISDLTNKLLILQKCTAPKNSIENSELTMRSMSKKYSEYYNQIITQKRQS